MGAFSEGVGWLGDGDHIVTTEVADLLHFNHSSSLQTHVMGGKT